MNTSKTNEQALEAAIEKALTGTCLEEMKANENTVAEPQELFRSGNGYYIGNAEDFNPNTLLTKPVSGIFSYQHKMTSLKKLSVLPTGN